MRLLQLRTDPSSLLDLHPNLTVVQGLDPATRSRLVDAVRGLADGVAAGEGLLEAHGVLFDLGTEMLAMLDVAQGERPPVVTVDDLPSIPDDPERLARLGAQRALAEATERWQEAADQHAHAVAEVDAARRRLHDLQSQLVAAEVDASGRLDSVDERTAQVDRVMGRRPLADEEAAERLTFEHAPAAPTEAPSEVPEGVQVRVAEIDQQLAAMAPQPIDHVRAEIDRVRGLSEVVLVPSPEATALADQLEALLALGDDSDPLGAVGLAGARARLDDARHSLLEAEQAMRKPPLDREAVDRLEAVHAELLDALDRVDKRLTGRRARLQAEQLRAREEELLEELAFASYSDYMMGGSLQPVDPGKEAALAAAREELTAAEGAWQALQAHTDAELRRAEALDRRRVLVERAHRLLGRSVPARSVVAELRSMMVEAAPTGDPAAPLRAALAEVGVELGPADLSRQDVLLVAEAWVEERAIDDDRLDELVRERSELEAERASRVAVARHDLVEVEGRLAAHREAHAEAIGAEAEAARHSADHQATPGPERLEELRAKVADVAGALQLRERAADDAARALARQEDEQRAATTALEELGGDADAEGPPLAEEIEWYLLARLAAQRSVSLGGSVPLLLDEALDGVPEPGLGRILGRLERMADAVQVILVTDDAAVASWATLAGPDRAAVVRVQPA